MKNLVKVERARLDWTQAQLAEELGVSRQTIHAIEKNKFNPSVILAIKMAKLFNVTVEELFSIEQE
ncbi:helix-turn-helix transcriptional regulator [Maribacter stanieri]|jgi:putative transcriptional regulator|uniref:Putative transcriptional regulator n=1 Tax=Maribacter stanieri TaxID=440514 RepID=A0A1I6HQP1_9FLAO|nr:helix-turn-helix transcriptional regulator [Maribacter stanieri]SFR56687.1 putative transcriptional regulator [Maribacter stanieri]|tara:strand:+ start:654 stop:851 length:198 start_codon:yes stop_codon:yes gene_type:complete